MLIRYQSNDLSAEYSLGGRFGADEDEIEDILNCIHKHGLIFSNRETDKTSLLIPLVAL